MDHTLLDVMILNDRQQPVRPWLTIVLDDYSRAIAGYALVLGATVLNLYLPRLQGNRCHLVGYISACVSGR